ncbi:UDP-arabinose 4-epimerase [Rhodovulum iodosum]|uniref:UDP-glucose 4-epimerase n=1 Tax=Rhodovulum iodosum TaxID=68291 RepID=A0ABV3XUK2_9RHOB|nr:UDP-glucose 4-epimerase GalE [Rhodovulum robiginosum]RSK32200.1 UDP-glucose 4-epimerase GalE [Rhodovulum robiginosum]
MSTPAILVTGGAGFIGSHTCKALAGAGYLPVTLDNLSRGNRQDVRWGPFVEADTRDTARVAAALRQHRVSAVIHFAAYAYVGESVEQPEIYYDANVGGLLSVLRACREAGVDKVIFSSSCATYGIPDAVPICEDAPQRPINPYGRTKLIGEQVLIDYARAYGMHHAILRYFNAAGADPAGELSEKHVPETHLIPLALMAAAGRIPRLDVYGTDYPTPDGTCIRDYIHVADLADGHRLALTHLLGGGADLELNLGTGHGQSIFEVLDAVRRVTGRSVPTRLCPRRPGDPPALVADAGRARRMLGFAPQHSGIETIVRHAAPSFGVEKRHEERA